MEDKRNYEGKVIYHTGFDSFLFYSFGAEVTWHETRAATFSNFDRFLDLLAYGKDPRGSKLDTNIVDWCVMHMNDLEVVPAIVDASYDQVTHGTIKKIDYKNAETLWVLVEQRMDNG